MAVVFEEDFAYGTGNTAPGVAWSTTKWTVTNNGTGNVGAYNAYGRMFQSGQTGNTLRASAKYTAIKAQDVTLKFWMQQNVSTRHRITIMGSGSFVSSDTSGDYNLYGYSISFSSSTTGLAVTRMVNGTGTAMGTVSLAAADAGGWRWLRFQVSEAGVVRLKTWTPGSSEPGTWALTYTDTGFATMPAGVLILNTRRSSNATVASGYNILDSITVDNFIEYSGWGIPL